MSPVNPHGSFKNNWDDFCKQINDIGLHFNFKQLHDNNNLKSVIWNLILNDIQDIRQLSGNNVYFAKMFICAFDRAEFKDGVGGYLPRKQVWKGAENYDPLVSFMADVLMCVHH